MVQYLFSVWQAHLASLCVCSWLPDSTLLLPRVLCLPLPPNLYLPSNWPVSFSIKPITVVYSNSVKEYSTSHAIASRRLSGTRKGPHLYTYLNLQCHNQLGTIPPQVMVQANHFACSLCSPMPRKAPLWLLELSQHQHLHASLPPQEMPS